MSKKPLVSIIIPVYNSSAFIESTINSVIQQTYCNWELILIDDCSTDNSVEIIKRFEIADQRILLIKLPTNSGTAIARNTGLKLAKSNFIAFLDSDDIWLPIKLELQTAFMLSQNAAISFSAYQVFDDKNNNKSYIIPSVKTISYEGYLKNTIIGLSTAMINRDILGYDAFFKENMRTRQDTDFWIFNLKKGFIAFGISEVLVRYRIHNNSISKNKFKAAKNVWLLYRNYLTMPSLIYYFTFYVFNTLKKRLIKKAT